MQTSRTGLGCRRAASPGTTTAGWKKGTWTARGSRMPGSGWMVPFTKGTWWHSLLPKPRLLQHSFRKHFKTQWYPVLGTSTGQQRASKQLRPRGGRCSSVMRCSKAVQRDSQALGGMCRACVSRRQREGPKETTSFIWGLNKAFEHHLYHPRASLVPPQGEIKPSHLQRVLGSSPPCAPPPQLATASSCGV